MTLDPPRAGPQSRISRLIEDYNPFYLLSAACMLFGVFALNDSLDWSPIGLRRLLTMIVTLNVYELAVIGLAVFLMRRDIRRDAMLLLIVEAFFLADVGFLNMEIFATSAKIGLLVNAIVFAAAVMKVGLVFSAARIPLADSRFAFVVMQLAVLFAVPGIFGAIAQGRNDFLPPLAIYAAWWLAGALPVAYTMTVGSVDLFRRRADGLPSGMDITISRVLIVLPMLSLIAHLCLANWVYKVTFHPANIAPLLLGFAILAGHADEHVGTLARRMRLQLVLPFVAVALSAIKFPPELIFPITPGIDASPLRTALIVASVVYLEGFWQFRQVWFAIGSGTCVILAAMGHSVVAINNNSIRVAQTGASAFDRLVPKTLAEWGMYSIGLSFVLLAIGAMISLNRKPPAVEEAAADPEG
jgi:hypothetical protein